jgi:hypothetical protein
MIIGHYALALAAKTWAPRTSLGTLIPAAAFLDLLWPVLLLLGVEEVVIAPGVTAFTPLDFTNGCSSRSPPGSTATARPEGDSAQALARGAARTRFRGRMSLVALRPPMARLDSRRPLAPTWDTPSFSC